MVDLTKVVPEFRTILPFKADFPYPKDPEDNAWYAIAYGEQLSSADAATIVSGGDETLVIDTRVITADLGSVALYLKGGTQGVTYGIRVAVTTQGGDQIFRTVRLIVAGN